MRPDIFKRMVEAYYYNEQKEWLKWRPLHVSLYNLGAEQAIKETEYLWLPYIDKPEVKEKYIPRIFTEEEKRQMAIRDGIIKE